MMELPAGQATESWPTRVVPVFQREAGAATQRVHPAAAGWAGRREGAPQALSSWGPGWGPGKADWPAAATSPCRRMAAALQGAYPPGNVAPEVRVQAAFDRAGVRGRLPQVKMEVLRQVPSARARAPARGRAHEGPPVSGT